MLPIISGIQQIGVGVHNAIEAFEWYKKVFGTDIIVFKDAAKATLMQQYTGHIVHTRYAILALNLQGGGGFEFWQYTSRQALPPTDIINWGDLGILAIKIKCKNIFTTYQFFKKLKVDIVSLPSLNAQKIYHFYMYDPYKNLYEIIEDIHWFSNTEHPTGGVCGIIVGVSCLQKATQFYENILGFDVVVYKGKGTFNEWQNLPSGKLSFDRIILKQSKQKEGAFSNLLGPIAVELVQAIDRNCVKIFKNRYWGDIGFIHACFDINGMQMHEQNCNNHKYPLTVNSNNSFDMGNAAGQFAYNEDPDGTLIEYVETHKLPILKKLGLYLNLKNRDPKKPLPNWMLKSLRFSRVK